MKPNYTEIYNQLIELDFIKDYIKEYEGICEFNEQKIMVDVCDAFGQCSVYLGFDDQFAIRDAFGNWREASAEECLLLSGGKLPGSMSLIN